MPIDASPSGTLDIENATLRSRNIASLTNMVAGNDVIRDAAAPTLEVYGDPSHGGTEPTLELVSNTSNTVSTTFTRLTSNAGVFSIQSGTAGTADSKADIAFASIGGNTEHMRIKGSSGNVGIGTVSPATYLHLSAKNSNPGATEADGVGTHDLTEYLRFTSTFDGGDVNAVSVGFKLGADDNSSVSPDGRLDICANDGAVAGNSYGATPDRTIATFLGSGNVGIGTTNPGTTTKLEINGDVGIGRVAGGYTFREVPGGDIRAGVHSNFSNHLIFRTAGNSEKMRILHDGRVGIGRTDPISRFNVKQSVDNSPAGSFIISPVSGSLSYWGMYVTNGNDFSFHQNGSDRGYLANGNNVTAIDFTGQHRNFIDGVSYADYGSLEGLIVSANKNKYYDIDENVTAGANAIQISQSLPLVALSNVAHDKACFGVISGVEDPESREYAQGSFVSVVQKQIGDRRAFINSVGEGAIWVTNINGPLESGDYITTSNVAGYGQKQDSDSLKNYTVAKITMDCNFDPATQPVQIIKKELQDVNYWVKTTYENVTEEEYSNLTDENRRIVDGIYQKIIKEESKTEQEGYELEVRQELVNILDEHGQIQWEDDPSGATEKAYKIRYLDADGNITDEANAVHIAAFVGCTYHCG